MAARPTYHHGALREALLEAGEKILRERGVAGLSLRAIAREAGVSHGAPAHHFQDLAGLLSELAAVGFRRFSACLRAARPTAKPKRFARAYITFALENPAMFTLMFREGHPLDHDRPALAEARREAFEVLRQAMTSAEEGQRLRIEEVGAMAAGWSVEHGLAVLAIDGGLQALLALAPPGASLDELLDSALAQLEFTEAKA